MKRLRFKISLLTIAIISAIFWAQPVYMTTSPLFALGSALWIAVLVASFRGDKAEDWAYRVSAFFAVTLATVEAGSLMLVRQAPQVMGWMALLHGAAFFLSVIGRYQKVRARRPKRMMV